jgi:hypothetical protein
MSRYQLSNPEEVIRDDELLSTVPSADCPVYRWERPPKIPDLSPILEGPSTPVGQMVSTEESDLRMLWDIPDLDEDEATSPIRDEANTSFFDESSSRSPWKSKPSRSSGRPGRSSAGVKKRPNRIVKSSRSA